ncbi:unnamed protein product [Durusdinium trenchii]|uniref:STAS domain-containing protein n=1 Tax=Durusdinium trenchii TaxID=1381693 RepID=A0ABP0PG99_9DINO
MAMRSAHVAPDESSYSSLMSAVSRSGDWKVVLDLLWEMPRAKVTTDSVCFSVAMGACEKASEWLVALELFEMMHARRLHQDVFAFGNAICAMSKGSHWPGALKLLGRMQKEGISLDTVVCNSCLTACAASAQWEAALDLLRLMTAKKVAKTTATCNAVVRSLEASGEHKKAVAVLLHEFVDEEPSDEIEQPSMFRSARPKHISQDFRRSVAERLERGLDFAGGISRQPRPVVAMAQEKEERPSAIGPAWCQEATEAFNELVLSKIRPEPNLVDHLAHFVAQLENTLSSLGRYGPVRLVPYGSIISRFAAKDADADFSLLFEAEDASTRQFQQQVLIEWRRELLSQGFHVKAIGLGGRVPVLTIQWGSNRTADVTIGNQLGIYKSQLLRDYSLLDDRLCALVMAVKHWAKLRQICGQTRGYLGGYAWTLMAIYFAQRCRPPLTPPLQELAEPKLWEQDGQLYNVAWKEASQAPLPSARTSASLLQDFFQFFSEGFDFHFESVSIRLGCRAIRHRGPGPAAARLSLEDPIETDWDLGQILDGHRLSRVRAELRRAHRHLQGAQDQEARSCLEAVFQAKARSPLDGPEYCKTSLGRPSLSYGYRAPPPEDTDGKHDETYVGRMEKGESIEITTCSEEVSQDQREILQERQLINNPVKMCMRSCVDHINGVVDDAATPKKSKRPRKETSMLDKISKIVTILQWVPDLTCHKVRADLVAGLTVGVMVIPQSMSYGAIAGLPYINGMYSACIPTLIYAFFGQSRQLAVGPVAMVSLLVEAGLNGQLGPECTVEGKPQYETCPQEYVGLACLTAAVVGVMQILASVLKLGFLVTFLGHPVISGFTSGAAIIIGLSQLKYILGFDLPKSQYIYETIYNVIIKIDQTKGMPLLLGILWIAYLLGNKHLAQKYKRLKMLGPLGPLISCLVGTVLIGVFHEFFAETYHVKYVGEIPSGIMPLSLDAWQLDKIPTVLGTAMSACLIGYMESIAIGKNLAATNGYDIDAGQEMLALGIANVVGAAFSCYPVTGSFSRSAVNNSTGALSQLSGVITAVVMLATLMFLTPLFYYLPKFALAAIVMNSVIPLVAFGEARHLFHVKKHDFVLWVTAFLGTLFLGVLMGILVSVGLSLVIVIYESARPQITILWRIPGTSIYRNMKQENNGTFIQNVFIARIGSSLYFANASFVKEMLLAHVTDLEEVNKTQYIVLEMTPVISVDSTACHVIKDVVNDFRMRGMHVAFAMTGNRVEKTLRKAGLKKFIGEQWFFPTVEEAVQYCVKHQHARRRQSEREEMESQNHAKSDELLGWSSSLVDRWMMCETS